jgi:hypothetical protein
MFTDNKLAISLSSHMVTGNPWISAWVQHRIQIRFCLCGSIKFPIKLYNNTLSEVSFYAETPCTGRYPLPLPRATTLRCNPAPCPYYISTDPADTGLHPLVRGRADNAKLGQHTDRDHHDATCNQNLSLRLAILPMTRPARKLPASDMAAGA